MTGYVAKKGATQMTDVLQDMLGNIVPGGSVTVKYEDGSPAATFGTHDGNTAGTNPSFTDGYGYSPTYLKHGDYYIDWNAFGDAKQRWVRVPPLFEDFGMVDFSKYSGADPTGVTDSGVALQRAVNECAGKYKLYIPPGTWRVDNHVLVPSYSYLIGLHPSVSILQAGSISTNEILYNNVVGWTTIVIENLGLDGNYANRASDGRDCAYFRGNTGSGSVGYGKVFENFHFYMRGCWVYNSPFGGGHLQIRNCQYGAIENNWFHSGKRDAITGGLKSHFAIIGNLVTAVGDDGITFSDAQDCTVIGNVIDYRNALTEATRYTGRCVWLPNAHQIDVCGNILRSPDRGGVVIEANSWDNLSGSWDETPEYYCENVNVVGNIIQDAGSEEIGWGDGILVRDLVTYGQETDGKLRNIRISDNQIVNCRRDGIRLDFVLAHHSNDSEVDGFDIRDNNIFYDKEGAYITWSDHAGVGINVVAEPVGPVKNLRIEGNTIRGMEGGGIYVAGKSDGSNQIQNVRIVDNIVRNCGYQGVSDKWAIYVDHVDNLRLSENDCLDDQTIGGQSQKGIRVGNVGGTVFIFGNDPTKCKTPLWDTSALILGVNAYIEGNFGYTPLEGLYTSSTGAWSNPSGNLWTRSVTIPFGVTITGSLAKAVCSADLAGYGVSVTSISNTAITAAIWTYGSDPGSSKVVKVYWRTRT